MRTPSSARTGATWRMAGWKTRAKRKPKPSSSMASPTLSGGASRSTPRASRRSAEPALELAARFPCLATATPPAAATRAARVERLRSPFPSPPVPTRSKRGRRLTLRGLAASRMARAMAAISWGRSPLRLMATKSPAARTGETSPAIRARMTS